jgi:hypothetical protein
MWSSGDVVALRELWDGRIWKARAWIVVEDGPEQLILWIPKGAQTMLPEGSELPVGRWKLAEGSFPSNALRLTWPGASHSILHFFDDGGRFERWYVNLERPLVRSPAGFDVFDLFLDLLVEPDGRRRWLDEHELEEALAARLISQDEAAAARAEGERVIEDWPFPTGWESWRPDPRWEQPRLPAGWDVLD